ncbi:unnamed protein product [Hyaloperonospora brassicae]|uniref:RxLR effector protein n=1 Tax=Hyaloperonospora brassicae TaxID=162125 RepID=A0AAV0V0H4_HYABA|nr:unnamed protein product [Hyaloperonospora brassicae]
MQAFPLPVDGSLVYGHNGVSGDRQSISNDTAGSEERVLSGTSSPIEVMAENMVSQLKKALHATPDPTLTNGAWTQLMKSDAHVLKRYKEMLVKVESPEALHDVEKKLRLLENGGATGLENVLDAVRTAEKELADQDVSLAKTKLLQQPQPCPFEKYVVMLKDAQILGSQHSVNWYAVEKLVELYNTIAKPPADKTLLDLFLIGFNNVPNGSRLLSISKKSRISGPKAEHLQNKIFESWIKGETSAESVFNLLKISRLSSSDAVYEKLDAFERYFALFNARFPDRKTNWSTLFNEHKVSPTVANTLIARGEKLNLVD